MSELLANAINLTNLSWDILVLVFLFTASVLYGFSLSRNRIALIILSTYVSFSFIIPLSYFENLVGKENIFFAKLSVFILLIILAFYLLNRSFLGYALKSSQTFGFSAEFFKKMMLALAQMGLFISIFFDMILTAEKVSVEKVTETLFMNHIALIAWLAVPIILLGIFRR